ncbi:uncharacterized protein LOC132936768 [Metopolophium dirhodum]|uniref:uncharacterized protein LOC132936768 n=1 Tax=Metopolophium dirhodum TaxID=44670 RepID=UPI00298FD317|nr:uncharacterized protein LOC132936768 [Metopolophium dirhodum]
MKVVGPILTDELKEAEIIIIKITQASYSSSEINDLNKNGTLTVKSKLHNLQPFLESGIIRVGGRIKNARHVEITQRHPILIPKNSTIARLILLNEHDRLLHAGPQAMLANSRLKYWIIGGRNIARHVFHQCVKCFRLRPTILEPIMADLPTERLEPNRPFKKCGVDYAGPIAIKTSLRRNAAVLKGYILCVFICFSTRAVHIELVADLTTEAFLNVLKRFIGRRGVCSDIFSDNATNFVGANNRLQDLKKIFHSEEYLTKIYDALSTEGTANLTYDELNTILIRIEAVLNSRPLTPCSSDPTDTTPLTPAHFLIGEPTFSLPEPDLTGIPDNRLKRWQRVTQLTQILWQRWNKEYLSQLQTRRKWLTNKGPKIKVGTIVLVKEDDAHPMSWSMGRIVHVQAGDDGVIRGSYHISKRERSNYSGP